MGSDPRRLVAIIDVLTRIASAQLDVGAILSLAATEARSLTGAQASVIEIVAPDGTVSQGAADGAAVLAGRLFDRSTLPGQAVENGEVMRCDDLENDPRTVDMENVHGGARSLIAAPVTGPDRVLGVVTVRSEQVGAFTDDDGSTLAQLGRFVGHQLEHARSFEEAHRTSRRDPLTGLGNRRALDETLVAELGRHGRYGGQLSVCVVDLDGFKTINDTAGHSAGDKVLVRVAERLCAIRGADSAFRLGGDEFALVLPETGAGAAELVARRLAHLIRDDAEAYGMTASWGVVEAGTGSDAAGMLAEADAQLYARKRAGQAGQASG